ncbi:MAG: anti-sigma regulatory factor [Syntrophobacteraceae bacterium]|jgi:serine/threonine-protein kinase RsbT|nr:anti-sigma regulatory factor [Syntrophobacteraceae bacterium]
MSSVRIEIQAPEDIISARQAAREIARKLGFKLADQTRLATAISELARNALQYAGGGTCSISDASDEGTMKVRVEVEDQGPGIADVEKAMTYGFTTGNGLGAGLPGSRSLVHEFQLTTSPGNTRVTVAMMRRRL